MDRKIGGERADEPADADILDDRGVDARGDDRAQVVFGGVELVGEDERIEGHVAAHPAAVQKFHQRRQVGLREIVRPHAGVETFQTEIDRVGTVFDRGARALPVAGGRKQLRTARARRQRELGRRGGKGGSGGCGHEPEERWSFGGKRNRAGVRQPSEGLVCPEKGCCVWLAETYSRSTARNCSAPRLW